MRFIIPVIIFFSLSNCVFAQEPEETNLYNLTLEELLNIEVDIASKKAETIFEAPSTVTLLDKDFLSRFNVKSVAEAISVISGVNVQRTYLKRNIPVIRGILQDHYANKVLVLINGVPSWNAVTGEGALDRIDINSIERIEVLKGPASVMYGTNAYAGAINIVLKSNENKVYTNFGFGSNGIYNAGASVNFTKNGNSFFAAGNINSDNGKSQFITDENNSSGYYNEFMRNRNFVFSFKSPHHSFLFNAAETRESFLGVEPAFKSGLGTYHLIQGYLTAYNFQTNILDNLSLNNSLSLDYNERVFPRNETDTLVSQISGYRLTNSLGISYQPVENLSADLGFEYDWRKSIKYSNFDNRRLTTLADNNLKNREVYSISVYSQISYGFSSFKLLAGSRLVYNKLYKSDISSRATLVYLINDKNSLKLIWGQSYRAPSLFELYFENGKTVFGNTQLKPEKSQSTELAYLTSFDKFFAQVLVYYSFYNHKIFRVKRLADPNDKSTIYINGSKFAAKGIELELKYLNASLINAFVTYSFVDGDNGDELFSNNHYNFRHSPKHTLSAGLSKLLLGVNISAISNFIGATYGVLSKIDAAATFDFNISYEQSFEGKQLVHSVSIKNAFDKTVYFPEFSRGNLNEIPSGYGRRISYNLSLSL